MKNSLNELIKNIYALSIRNNNDLETNKESYIRDLKLMLDDEGNINHTTLNDIDGTVYKTYYDDISGQELITLKANPNEIILKKDFIWDLNSEDLSQVEETEVTKINLNDGIDIERLTGHNVIMPKDDSIYYDNLYEDFGLKTENKMHINNSKLEKELKKEIKELRNETLTLTK